MDSDLEDAPHVALWNQLQSSFSTIYLTMLSIIQGVALADLANVVSDHYVHFTIVNWILAVTEFCIIAEVWTHFMTDATSKGWIPGYGDSILFFGLGGGELYLNHAIVLGLTAWLFGMVGSAVASLLALVFIRRREEHDVDDPMLLSVLRRRESSHRVHALAGIALFSLGFIVCQLAHIGVEDVHSSKAIIAIGYGLLSAGWIAALIIMTAIHWEAVVHYVRTGTEPEKLWRPLVRQ